MGLKETILAATDAQVIPFNAPEWGSPPLFLRTVSGAERDRFEAANLPAKDGAEPRLGNVRARFAVLVLGDSNGVRVFSDEDAPALGLKSAAVLDRVWSEGRKFNAMDKDAIDQAKKDSAATAGDASSTGSPSPAA